MALLSPLRRSRSVWSVPPLSIPAGSRYMPPADTSAQRHQDVAHPEERACRGTAVVDQDLKLLIHFFQLALGLQIQMDRKGRLGRRKARTGGLVAVPVHPVLVAVQRRHLASSDRSRAHHDPCLDTDRTRG